MNSVYTKFFVIIRQMENSGITNDRPTGMTGTVFMVCMAWFVSNSYLVVFFHETISPRITVLVDVTVTLLSHLSVVSSKARVARDFNLDYAPTCNAHFVAFSRVIHRTLSR